MIEEIAKRILDKLTGADFWIALGFLVAGVVCCLLIGTTEEPEPTVLRLQIGATLVLALVAGGAIWANHFFFQRAPVFSKDVTGILIMRMEGDDAKASLQRILIANLNAKLQNEALGQQIEVHAGTVGIDENKGIAAAHQSARAIGQRLNAKLVIWGQIGDKKFYPRITVVDAPKDWSAASERTRDVQNITELNLPEELVDEPFYLIHFAAGYSYYGQRNYKGALPHFKAALQRKGSSASELADLQFLTAFCHLSLGAGQKDIAANLREAIELYENAAKVYEEGSNQDKWAATQSNLGYAYGSLPAGDRAANLQTSIGAYKAALRVYTEKDFPAEWAQTQNNLGIAYDDLRVGDRAENLQKAIGAYEAALRVRTKKAFPVAWAQTQNNLGIAYGDLPGEGRAENLQKAIGAYEAALSVYTEKDFPVNWAKTQTNLGNAYLSLSSGNRAANLQKALVAYGAALRISTEKDFPVDWAMIQYNLGIAYGGVAGGNRTENLKNAKVCFEAALRVYTESGFPMDHRDAAAHLAEVEHQLRSLTLK